MKTITMLKYAIFFIAGLEGIQSVNSMQMPHKMKSLTLSSFNHSHISKNSHARHYCDDQQNLPVPIQVELTPRKWTETSSLVHPFMQKKVDLEDIHFFVSAKEALNYYLYSDEDVGNLIEHCLRLQDNELEHIEKSEDMIKARQWLDITKLNLYHAVNDLRTAREGIKYIVENYEEAKAAADFRISRYRKHLKSESAHLCASINMYKTFNQNTQKYIYDNLLFLCYDLVKKMNAFDLIYSTFLNRNIKNYNIKLESRQTDLDPTTFKIINEPIQGHPLTKVMTNPDFRS